jgi:NadR type nicotinamide-nucleotide adenylyltransferase
MLKVLITGPESSGKTQLTKTLARHFRSPWVPEFARTYLKDLDRAYQEKDLLQILDGQLRLQQQHREAPLLFCDTGPEVIHVWSKVKFGRVDDHITEMLHKYSYDLTFLCHPDLSWTPDPLREAPDLEQREQLLVHYQKLLAQLGRSYIPITGQGDQRTELAIKALEKAQNI